GKYETCVQVWLQGTRIVGQSQTFAPTGRLEIKMHYGGSVSIMTGKMMGLTEYKFETEGGIEFGGEETCMDSRHLSFRAKREYKKRRSGEGIVKIIDPKFPDQPQLLHIVITEEETPRKSMEDEMHDSSQRMFANDLISRFGQ